MYFSVKSPHSFLWFVPCLLEFVAMCQKRCRSLQVLQIAESNQSSNRVHMLPAVSGAYVRYQDGLTVTCRLNTNQCITRYRCANTHCDRLSILSPDIAMYHRKITHEYRNSQITKFCCVAQEFDLYQALPSLPIPSCITVTTDHLPFCMRYTLVAWSRFLAPIVRRDRLKAHRFEVKCAAWRVILTQHIPAIWTSTHGKRVSSMVA